MTIIDTHLENPIAFNKEKESFSSSGNGANKGIISGCIIIESQHREEENVNLLNLCNKNPFIKGVVGWIDFNSSKALDQLSYYSSHSKFLGVRASIQVSNLEKLVTPSFEQAITFLRNHNLTLDFYCEPQFLKVAKELADSFTEQKFILNYLGNPYLKEGILIPWADDIFSLSESPNIFCKLMGSAVPASFTYQQLEPFYSVALHAFGPNRVMFGSNTVDFNTDYLATLDKVEKSLSPLSDEDKSKIWSENALAVYGIE